MNVNDIEFGNPRRYHVSYLNKISYADKFYDQLVKFSPPSNDSKGTREELNEIVTNMEVLEKQPEVIEMFQQYDYNYHLYMQEVFKSLKFEEGAVKVMNDVLADVNPLIFKLKYNFNRPRPHQLARHYKLSLFPYRSYSDDSPSFPSAHAVTAHLFTHVFGNYYPEHYNALDDLAGDVSASRVYMGLNYQSDIDQALFIVEMIKTDKEFNNKYHL
jgi:hypothetical protein